MPKLSIIIPIYNSDKFLRECLESILIQNFKDYEVLLINDGSKDKSKEICEEYAEKDSRFIVHHKENGGVSSARNLALENARGEWIHFIDADDHLISNNVYNTLFDANKENKDIIRFGFFNGGLKINPIIRENQTDKDRVKEVLKSNYGFLWCNLFRHSIIGNTRFEKMSFAEDTLFLNQVMLKKFSILFVDEIFYFYRVNPDSALRGKYMKSFFEDSLLLDKKLKEEQERADVYNNLESGWATLTRFYFGLINEMKRKNITASVSTLNEYYDKFEIKKLIDERGLKRCMFFNKNWFFVRYRMFLTILLLHPIMYKIKKKIKNRNK